MFLEAFTMDMADTLYNMEEEAFDELEKLVKIAKEHPYNELATILKRIKRILEPL